MEPAGTKIPEVAPQFNHCGAYRGGWLNGAHPTGHGESSQLEVCFVQSNGNNCNWKTSITVTNCIDFYVYQLPQAPEWCTLRYCAA